MNLTRHSLLLVISLMSWTAVAAPALPRLFANHAAARWDHAYPVGNGSLGAMSLGTYPKNRVILNHDTIWSRPRQVEVPANARQADMDEAFALAAKGDYTAAQAAYIRAKNKGNSVATFQTLGALEIEHLDAPAAAPEIGRQLDLMTGVATSTASFADGVITETLLASYPDRCLALRLDSTRPEGLHFQILLNRPAGVTHRDAQDGELVMEGATGVKFSARVRVIPGQGGTVTREGEMLVIKGAKSATLFITAATDYHRAAPRQPRTDDWAGEAQATLEAAARKGWSGLARRAIDDHRALMERCVIDIGRSDPAVAALSTPKRLERLRQGGEDPELVATFFQLGRHMLISSSRPGSLPPNLQGLWEPGLKAVWNGDFHLNINVQMNLWPANVTGLDACNEPFFALIKLLRKYGANTAASLGCRGYAAGLASDAWGQSDWIGGSPEWDSWILGGHWAQQHLMEHFRFTGDREFLRETAWPILKDGSLFLLDWLRPHPENPALLISGPGASPENIFRYQAPDGTEKKAYISIGNTCDHEIARETLADTLEAAALLGIEDDFTREVAAALQRVPLPPIGTDGRIMEWWKPFGEPWPGHRHKSHLYGLHPGRMITPEDTPELARAAEASIVQRMKPSSDDRRGGGRVGWNLAWTANLWTRLHRGDEALAMIHEQLRTQVNENLFNRCGSPYQIDGNLGTPAAIAEMLVQSHRGVIHLLPALPKAWPDGEVTGLRARGGFTVDIKWRDGAVADYRITSATPRQVRVVVNRETKTITSTAAK